MYVVEYSARWRCLGLWFQSFVRKVRWLWLSSVLLPSLGLAGPPTEMLQLRVLVVVYTSSFSRTLTASQLERLHQEVAAFVDFYHECAGDVLDLDLTLLQIDRRLQLHEVQEVSAGRYYLSRENIEAELVQRGMKGRDFDEVVCFYAWDEQNRYGARLAYGGGAVGPDGKFLDDAGYNSIGVFAWDPGRISQIMIHEVLHNIDDMFSRSGQPDAFYSSDDMSRHIEELVRDRPGAFEPEFTDAEILDLAERERKGEEGYPWKAQLVYYRWMLRRTPREAWMRLHHGRKINREPSALTLKPLYSTLITSSANDRVYLAIRLRDPRNRPIGDTEVVAAPGRRLVEARYAHTDFEGKTVFDNVLYTGWVPVPDQASDLRVEARIKGRPEPLTTTVRIEPSPTAVIEVPPEVAFYRDSERPAELRVGVRMERFGGNGAAVTGALVYATVSGQRVVLKEMEAGRYSANLPALGTGSYPVTLFAEKEGWTLLSASTTVHYRLSWDLVTSALFEGQRGMPLEVWVRAVRTQPVDSVTIHAELGDQRIPMTAVGDGYFHARFEAVPDEVDHVRVVGQTPGDPHGLAIDKKVPLRAVLRGQIVADDVVYGRSGRPVRIVAQVRNRMGELLQGYAVPLVAIVGAEVVPLVDTEGDGRFVARVLLPPGQYRAKIVSLDGRVGVKNLRIRVSQ